jgi:hypothetical protein
MSSGQPFQAACFLNCWKPRSPGRKRLSGRMSAHGALKASALWRCTPRALRVARSIWPDRLSGRCWSPSGRSGWGGEVAGEVDRPLCSSPGPTAGHSRIERAWRCGGAPLHTNAMLPRQGVSRRGSRLRQSAMRVVSSLRSPLRMICMFLAGPCPPSPDPKPGGRLAWATG